MRKVCILSLAILLSMAFVPTAPAQVPALPAELPPEVTGLLCQLGLASTLFPGDGSLSGTNTGTSAYNSPGSHANVVVFSFCAAEGDAIDFFVDNVDTPSDVWACVTAGANDPCDPPLCCETNPANLGGDDEAPCSVPHFYSCPAGQAPLPADDGDGIYTIRVGTWSSPGGFDGFLTVNGEGVGFF